MSLILNVEILGEYKNLKKATDGAESTLKKFSGKFKDTGKKIGKAAGYLGAGAGAAVVSQIAPSIEQPQT